MNRYYIKYSNTDEGDALQSYVTEVAFDEELRHIRSSAQQYSADDCWAIYKSGMQAEWWVIGDGEEVKFEVLLNTDLIDQLPVRLECMYNAEQNKMDLCAAKVMYNIFHGCDITANLKAEAVAKFEAEAEKQIVTNFYEGHTTITEL